MATTWLFISHEPDEEGRKRNREKVAKHIGTHFRNRSKPLQQKRMRRRDSSGAIRTTPNEDVPTLSSVVIDRQKTCTGTALRGCDNDDEQYNPFDQSETVPGCAYLGRTDLYSKAADKGTAGIWTTTADDHAFPGQLCSLPELQNIALPPALYGTASEHTEWSSFAFDFQINYIFVRVANWGTGPNTYSTAFAQMMLHDQLLFDAVAASAFAWYSLEVRRDAKPALPILWYRKRALRGLHERLKQAPTSDLSFTILVIFYMLENAARLGCLRDFRVHYKGMQRIRDLRGHKPPQSLADMFADQCLVILESSEIASTATRQTNRKDHRKHIYPELPLQPLMRDAALTLPFGLKRLAMEGCLSIPVIESLCDVPVADYWHSNPHASERHSPIAARLRSLGLTSRLPIEKLVCLGALAFSLRLVAHMHLLPEMGFLQRIVRAGQRVQKGSEQLYRELNVWAVTIAADLAASTNEELKEQARAVLGNLRVQEKAWLRGWSDVENALKKFFYSDSFAVGWRQCWDPVFEQARTRDMRGHMDNGFAEALFDQ